MSKWTQSENWTRLRTETLAQWETFYKENQHTLQTVGIVALAGATGTVVGVFLGKGLLAIKGAAAVKVGATQAVTAIDPATTATTIQGAVNLLNQTALTGVTLADKVNALFHAVAANAVPLTAGAVGGGAVGVGVVRSRIGQVRDQLAQQVAQTAAAQAAVAHVQDLLQHKEAHLAELQAKLTTATPPPDNLEAIRGIGRVMAQRLNAAGIYTFADLAAQTPEQLREVIGTGRSAAMMHPEAWIAEAQQRITSAPSAAAITTPAATDEAGTV